jgi:hypothetical protein
MAALIVSVINREFRTEQKSTVRTAACQSFAVRIRPSISLNQRSRQDTRNGEEITAV